MTEPLCVLLRCQLAVKELRKLSESGIYETIELKQIKSAAVAVTQLDARANDDPHSSALLGHTCAHTRRTASFTGT